MGIGNVLIDLFIEAASTSRCSPRSARCALFEIGPRGGAGSLLLIVADLVYYWFHRLLHEVRFLWAAHVNHHSSQRYNLSTALRQSWTTPFTILLFWWPLALARLPAGDDPRRHRHQHALPVLDPHRGDRPPRAARSASSTRPRTIASTTAPTSSTSTATTPASSSSGTASSAPSRPSARRCATA